MSRTIWIDSRHAAAAEKLAQNLRYLLENVNIQKKPLAFACIGSSRIPGDNLGPIVGTILTRYNCPHIYGTMEEPLNALTLPNFLPMLDIIEKKYCLIAIDAAIGTREQSGLMTLTDECLYPGSGVAKNLPAIGHLHITGVFDNLESAAARQLLPGLCRNISLGLMKCNRKEL